MTMPFKVDQETILITGASGGLGEHFARVLAKHGARVILAARRVVKLEMIASEIIRSGGRAHTIQLDVTDSESIRRALDKIGKDIGPVTVLLNNAGIAIPEPALDLSEETWDRTLETNLKGCWLMSKAIAKSMVADDRPGNIINVASIAGLRVTGHLSAYGASKAGLISLTKNFALELARHNIRVNALAPGYIQTEMNKAFFDSSAGDTMRKRIPQRRIGVPSDLDGPLLLLASQASVYMTGSVIVVDGGHLQAAL